MTKRTRSKGGHKQHGEDMSFLLDSPTSQTGGISEYALPGLLFLIFVLGAFTVCWFTLQQQSSIDQLTQSYSAMQMRLAKFQQGMGIRDMQGSQGGQMEERILALEESQRQAQSQVETALQTTQQLKNTDLSSQVWSLRAEMDARRAEVEQVAVSAAALQAAVVNRSEEVEKVKQSAADILSANSALAVSVSGLAGTVADAVAKLDEQVTAVASLAAGLEGQAGELSDLAVSMDLHKVALEANNQQVAEMRGLLVAEQLRRALALEEQLQSVKQTLDDQLSTSQNLHSNLKAQLEAVHSKIAIGVPAGSDPEEVEPVAEEVPPVAEVEVEESSGLGEEQAATEEQDATTVEEEPLELTAVGADVEQNQEVEEVKDQEVEEVREQEAEEVREQEVEEVKEQEVKEQEVEEVREEPAEQGESEELIEEQQRPEETSEGPAEEQEQAVVEEEPVELPKDISTEEEEGEQA